MIMRPPSISKAGIARSSESTILPPILKLKAGMRLKIPTAINTKGALFRKPLLIPIKKPTIIRITGQVM
jgi:hypothetical protein